MGNHFKTLSKTLKIHSDTRWSSNYNAVKVLYSPLDKVVEPLEAYPQYKSNLSK